MAKRGKIRSAEGTSRRRQTAAGTRSVTISKLPKRIKTALGKKGGCGREEKASANLKFEMSEERRRSRAATIGL